MAVSVQAHVRVIYDVRHNGVRSSGRSAFGGDGVVVKISGRTERARASLLKKPFQPVGINTRYWRTASAPCLERAIVSKLVSADAKMQRHVMRMRCICEMRRFARRVKWGGMI